MFKFEMPELPNYMTSPKGYFDMLREFQSEYVKFLEDTKKLAEEQMKSVVK